MPEGQFRSLEITIRQPPPGSQLQTPESYFISYPGTMAKKIKIKIKTQMNKNHHKWKRNSVLNAPPQKWHERKQLLHPAESFRCVRGEDGRTWGQGLNTRLIKFLPAGSACTKEPEVGKPRLDTPGTLISCTDSTQAYRGPVCCRCPRQPS